LFFLLKSFAFPGHDLRFFEVTPGGNRRYKGCQDRFLNRRSQRGMPQPQKAIVSACRRKRRGKASVAREESSRKCAKFNDSTTEIPEEE
jgi:hypothetical protein